MERHGYSRSRPTLDNGRARRVYRVTPAGREALATHDCVSGSYLVRCSTITDYPPTDREQRSGPLWNIAPSTLPRHPSSRRRSS
jgi:DNA-binding MarR family transcriptional regulator